MGMSVPTALAFVMHAAMVLGVTLRVVMARPLPGVALAWILLVAAVPAAGFVLYLAFGERRIGGRRIARVHAIRIPRGDFLRRLESDRAAAVSWSDLPEAAATLDRLARAHDGFPTLAGNELELLTAAADVLTAIRAEVERARVSLHLQFYIWHPGGLADEVAAAVAAAARRGVGCRVLVDALGSARWLRTQWPAQLRAAVVQVVALLPVGGLRLLLQRGDLRNHRKIVVVDGEVAFTGSMNMVDPRFFKQDAGVGQWIDAMVRVRGPAVAGLLGVLLGDWLLETRADPASLEHASGLEPGAAAGAAAVQVLPSGPSRDGDRVVQIVLMLLFAARRRIVVTTPYFVPDEAVLRALRSAATRGVEVLLILPERVDSLLVRHASRSYFDDLLAAGVRVLLYRGGLLHTKSVVVDEYLAMFGTHNLDLRSMWLNFEVSLLVYDAAFVARLHALQASYLADCVEVDPAAWRARGAGRRLVENVVRLFSPLL
jgi:cardiolipin synthase